LTGRPEQGASTGAGDSVLVGELAQVLGHELGEIAALLDGYTELLESNPDDAVSRLRGTTARLREVYEQLLELARVAAAPLAPSVVDPAAALATAQRRAAVDIDIPSVPPVIADPAQLEELFVHILRSTTSTVMSGNRGGVIVRASHDGAAVRLDIGADPAPPRLTKHHLPGSLIGSGIVLVVSSQIAARNGGRLWVDGNPGSGRTISLTLPAAEP
jgi:two-component system nitrogen regulation sensor histidine kinase GlnL